MVGSQALLYSTSSCGALPGNNIFVHGQTVGFSQLAGSSINAGNPVNCRNWIYDGPSNGGSGNNSVGYWGNIFGAYSGCDLGITQTGYDVQTSEVLTSGGNDAFGPAGEQMIGHVFRRPQTTVTGTGSGSLSAATYYFKVTAVDVAGRESAPSPEISQAVGASSSISLSATTGIYFPASCNFYFGTSAGGEANYFNSTTVTNGTCTYTLATTTGADGESAGASGQRHALLAHRGKQRQLVPVLRIQRRFGNRLPRLQSYRGAILPRLSRACSFRLMAACTAINFIRRLRRLRPRASPMSTSCTRTRRRTGGKKSKITAPCKRWAAPIAPRALTRGPVSAVTGTGAAATYYTCTLPAGVMGAGQGIIITAVAKHTTGTAAVTYTLSFGGTSTTAVAPSGAANQLERNTYIIMNNPGSTSAQTISTLGQDSNARDQFDQAGYGDCEHRIGGDDQLAVQRGGDGRHHAGNVSSGIEAVAFCSTDFSLWGS